MRTLEEIESEIKETQEELKNVHGTETEVYSRIVGYYRAVRNWNKGKRDEFDHRKMFNIETSEFHKEKTEDSFDLKNNKNEYDFQKDDFQNESEDKNAFYEIYTRKTCPNCPPVKDFMNHIFLKGKAIDVDSEAGLKEAAEKGVFSAPTVIVYDKNGNETARGHNVEELEEIFETVLVGA